MSLEFKARRIAETFTVNSTDVHFPSCTVASLTCGIATVNRSSVLKLATSAMKTQEVEIQNNRQIRVNSRSFMAYDPCGGAL